MIRELKSCRFEWDEQNKELWIDNHSVKLKLNKVQAYALLRFWVRVSQWAFLRSKKQ